MKQALTAVFFLLLVTITNCLLTIDYNLSLLARARLGDAAATSVNTDIFGARFMVTFADHHGALLSGWRPLIYGLAVAFVYVGQKHIRAGWRKARWS